MQYIVQEKLFCADHIERKREQGKKNRSIQIKL